MQHHRPGPEVADSATFGDQVAAFISAIDEACSKGYERTSLLLALATGTHAQGQPAGGDASGGQAGGDTGAGGGAAGSSEAQARQHVENAILRGA